MFAALSGTLTPGSVALGVHPSPGRQPNWHDGDVDGVVHPTAEDGDDLAAEVVF